jgi:hypothetical protein
MFRRLIGSRKVVDSLKHLPLIAVLLTGLTFHAQAIGQTRYVEHSNTPGSFSIVHEGIAASLLADTNDFAGVIRAAGDLQADVERVTGRRPKLLNAQGLAGTNAIIVGTIGKSRIIDELVSGKKIDVSQVKGKWESFVIEVVPDPLPGIASALVIAGSDKRGTIYGIYDLSEQSGVSPWYWWADVPVRHQDELFVKAGRYVQGEPAVKYRGIFLNDEAPSLTGWVQKKYGNYNHQFYTNVFELLLRLKANYLWPAMWNNCFNEDDPLNPKLADEYGIVMGTSHVEPMMRADKEWNRRGYSARDWNYETHPAELRAFWKEGIERNKDYENIVTIAMRGKIDTPMSETAKVALLEQIVADQRKLIVDVMHTNISSVPQLWALYKEVQEYYEKGMRVPDDVTLLWCDDNWGNIRRLPTPEERNRSGGAGVYYHFDYVGDPRNYKWLNTVPITKVWEQMNLAHRYGADRIWIVNVGDLKPMEFPIEFFTHMAWNPERWTKDTLAEYGRLWAAREFGPEHAEEIADLVAKYTKYNGRRKPEQLEPSTFSLTDYREAETVFEEWKSLTSKAEKIGGMLPENARDAFFELVLYPVKASAQVAELYITAGKNRLYARQGRVSANEMAAEAKRLFQADADLSAFYNEQLAKGKWEHMMDQTHIGYTYWQQPPSNRIPRLAQVEPLAKGTMGIAIEGSVGSWPGDTNEAVLPGFDGFNRQQRYIDVYNRGRGPFEFKASSSVPWLVPGCAAGTITNEQRLWVSVDWSKAPKGSSSGEINLVGPEDQRVVVKAKVLNPAEPSRESAQGFVESEGCVSIEAEHYSARIAGAEAQWEKLDDFGRTLSAMSVFPVTARSASPPTNSACLEYKMYLFDTGDFEVESILAPTLNFVPGRGLRFGISFDDAPPQIVDALEMNSKIDWETAVSDGVRKVRSKHSVAKPGYHTLKFWMVDPGVVLEKLVVDFGGVKPSYLGPPESFRGVVN